MFLIDNLVFVQFQYSVHIMIKVYCYFKIQQISHITLRKNSRKV